MHTLSLSPGSWTILALAGFSSIALLFYQDPPAEGLEFWLFSKHHESMYRQTIVGESDPVVSPVVISFQALERRLLSGFLSDTPVPDVVEVEIAMAARFFSGPLEAIGFLDLRERIEAEGLAKISAWLEPYCQQTQLQFCPRMQVHWYGLVRGT